MPEYTLVNTKAFSQDVRPIKEALDQAIGLWEKRTMPIIYEFINNNIYE